MSSLVVFDFDGVHTADEVLNKLRALQKEYLIDLEDACVVERPKGGKVHIKQAVNLTTLGATAGGLRGAMWGTLVGLHLPESARRDADRRSDRSGRGSTVGLTERLRHPRRLYQEAQ